MSMCVGFVGGGIDGLKPKLGFIDENRGAVSAACRLVASSTVAEYL